MIIAGNSWAYVNCESFLPGGCHPSLMHHSSSRILQSDISMVTHSVLINSVAGAGLLVMSETMAIKMPPQVLQFGCRPTDK